MTMSADTRNRLLYALANTGARDELATTLDNIALSTDATTLVFSKLVAEPAADTIIAHAGGGQALATVLTAEINRISTVAASGDSIMLPASKPGLDVIVINHGANPMQVYGSGTDTINDVATATGVSQMQGSVTIYVCTTAGNWYANGLGTGYSGAFETLSSQDAMTALAGGAQAGTALKAMMNRFTIVASAADSAQLPVSVPGMQIVVINAHAANSMNVFGQTGDSIDAGAANAASAVAAGKTATFFCTVAGKWHKLLSA
jgi:hypothetical protein